MVEAARALAGERGEPPAVRRVRGEGGARESCRENDSRQYAERRDEDVAGDPPFEGDGEQERQRDEPDERGQGASRDADEDRGPEPVREEGRLDVPVADVAPQHPAPGRDHEHDRQYEGGEEQHPRIGPALAAGGREPLVERRVRQRPDDAQRMRPGVHEHRPRQRRRAAFQEAPCGALAPCLGDAGQHLPGPEGDQLRLLDAPLAFGAAFIERRAFRRDRRQLGRPAVGRRRAQGAEKLPHRLGVGRRRDRRDCGIALDLLDLRAERLDDGVVDLRLVELAGDEVEQQAPVGGSALDVRRRARGLGGCAYRERDTDEQDDRAADAPVHGGTGLRGRRWGMSQNRFPVSLWSRRFRRIRQVPEGFGALNQVSRGARWS